MNGVLRCSAYDRASFYMRSGQRYVWGKDSYGAKVGFRVEGVKGVYRGGYFDTGKVLNVRCGGVRWTNPRTVIGYGNDVGFLCYEWCG